MKTEHVKQLSDYIKENSNTPFQWGVFDCSVFASKAIEIQTGMNLRKEFEGKYFSKRESLEIQKSIDTIENIMDSHFSRINPNFASRGDIYMLENNTMGVEFGGVLSTTEAGIKPAKNEVRICWRVS